MSIQELQAEAEKLTPDERRQLAAYLVSLRHRDRADYRAKMASKLDNTDPANWVTLEAFDKRFSS